MPKRVFDVLFTVALLPVALPIIAVTALVVRVRMGTPVLYREDRLGYGGRAFRIIKFRTMIEGFDDAGRPLPDEERLTRLGRFLRATSLDELPELFLVLTGDMSLVGPRPLPMVYGDLYNTHQRRRHEVRPGITGLAQIRGRNALSWEERLAFDVEYVDSRTFTGDLIILGRTVWAVLHRRGVSADGHATMYPFQGTPEPPAEGRSNSSAKPAD